MSNFSDLIGIPFEYGGRDVEESLDCYGLILHIENCINGKDLPDFGSSSDGGRVVAMMSGALHLFEPVEAREGAILLFRVPGYMHVGYCLEDDRFIHTWEESGGVTIERLSGWERRMIGAYKYVG